MKTRFIKIILPLAYFISNTVLGNDQLALKLKELIKNETIVPTTLGYEIDYKNYERIIHFENGFRQEGGEVYRDLLIELEQSNLLIKSQNENSPQCRECIHGGGN
jgi:hypothetical protein